MKLKQYRVREFRSIWDSGPIEVDGEITCLVGKNEAGKTALLTALYRSNPVWQKDKRFELTYDYPKSEIEDYRHAIDSEERDETVVVECVYDLDQSDIDAVAEVFGPNALSSEVLTQHCYYETDQSEFELGLDETAAIRFLWDNPELPDSLKTELAGVDDWESFAAILSAGEATAATTRLIPLIKELNDMGLNDYIAEKILWPRAPKFLYFSEYYQLEGRSNLNALSEREAHNQLTPADQPLLGLLNLARLNHQELQRVRNTTELKNKLEGAGNHLTRRIVKYWSQNRHIQMRFDVRDGKQGDPEGMRTGMNVWAEVYDSVHMASTPLDARSRGFVWFFSFLAWYEDVKRKGTNVILLLDEPGLSLHGKAQGDLLKYFQEELAQHQLIYTTHSPFMIDPARIERVRIVQDLGIDSAVQLPKEEDGTKVLANVFDGTEDSLFPLQAALGYEIQQTLFIAPNTLVVEGASDLLFLQTISAELEREGREGLSPKWVITPVGGSGKVPTFVALLGAQPGINLATLLDFQHKDRQFIENLYQEKLIAKKNVATYAQFVGSNEADLEDMFDRSFYLEMVNREFDAQLSAPIPREIIESKDPRILRVLDGYLTKNPMISGSFGHYRPARYFLENFAVLWPDVSEKTKSRFEEAFRYLNALTR